MREFWLILGLFLTVLTVSYGQFGYRLPLIRWCSVGEFEHQKCLAWSRAVDMSKQFNVNLTCVNTNSKDQCMTLMDDDKVDLMSLDPGEVFMAGRYHSLVPIMAERYGRGSNSNYFAVAVVKRNSNIRSEYDLRGRRACFTGVGQMAGWILPVVHLLRQDIMQVRDCNNHVKSAAHFFGPSCAPNALTDKHNPIGDNPYSLCKQCSGHARIKCSGVDPNAGFSGAFNCLLNDQGEIAFVKHTTVEQMVADPLGGRSANDYELLCQYGKRMPITSYSSCHWGVVPGHAVVTSSARVAELRSSYQQFITKSVQLFGGSPGSVQHPDLPSFQTGDSPFYLFESFGRYGKNYNLLFSDDTTRLDQLGEMKQSFTDYLGDYKNSILELTKCPVARMRMCVVSEMELEKCQKMKTAFRARMLKPELSCFKGHSHRECMEEVQRATSDVVVLDAGDIYMAGRDFGLAPVMAEQYDLDEPYYYAVAIASIEDRDSDLLYVRGKRTCHTSMGSAAGWVVPVSFLLKNQRLRDHGCDGPKAASEFFEKSCIPGALSPEFNRNFKQNTMCDLCHGSSSAFCKRDHTEDFFGYTGALRCLVEGGGDIAFVKHTTVFENTDGRNPMWWSRNVLAVDFELLCRDGSRAPVHEYARCHLAKVPGNAIVTRPYNETEIEAFTNIFLYAQQFYGSKFDDDFKFQMFQSEFPYHDLIFQDAAQQLKPVPYEKRHFHKYLGEDFLHAKRSVDCTASAPSLFARRSYLILIPSIFVMLMMQGLVR